MKKIAIIGAGGFGREVKMLIDQINEVNPTYEIVGFFDDNDQNLPETVNGYPVLGNIDSLIENKITSCLALGIGLSKTKLQIVKRLSGHSFEYPNLIHPNVVMGNDNVELGKGNIICSGNIITCDITIKNFVTLNLSCTVGHDTAIDDYASFMPSVNISGEVHIHKAVYVGTGAKIINQLEVGKNAVIGAGAVVAESIPSDCTAVGVPAKPIKFHNE